MKKQQKCGKGKSTRRINPKARFSENRLTSRAGLIPMGRFIDKPGIPGMILKAISLGVISGCRHLSGVVRLGMDEALTKTQGWERFPVLSSITRVLNRFEFRNRIELGEIEKKGPSKGLEQKVVWTDHSGLGFLIQECIRPPGRSGRGGTIANARTSPCSTPRLRSLPGPAQVGTGDATPSCTVNLGKILGNSGLRARGSFAPRYRRGDKDILVDRGM